MTDVLLVTVTVVSLVLAGVMAAFSWRVLQLDRRRSDVRVRSVRAAASQLTTISDATTGLTERPPCCDQVDSTSADSSGASPELFTARASRSGTRLFVAVAIVSVVFMAVAAGGLMLSTRSTVAEAETSTAPPATGAAVPLELLALDHVRDGSHLSIRGLVKNPAGASTMKDVVAVAYLFDRIGGYVGNSRAPVAETVLEPGTESRFEIPVPDARPVGRYRITFQMSLAPVPHVDRRTIPGAEASPARRVAFVAQGRGGAAVASAVR